MIGSNGVGHDRVGVRADAAGPSARLERATAPTACGTGGPGSRPGQSLVLGGRPRLPTRDGQTPTADRDASRGSALRSRASAMVACARPSTKHGAAWQAHLARIRA